MGEKPNEKEKVVMFPQLSGRLYEKGMDALKQKKFKEALPLFRQLSEIDHSYEEVEVGIVLCLLELGQFKEAKEKCERLLKQDIGDYFNVLQIYITILIQLREYDEIVTIIEAVIQEERIPPKDAENFYQILDYSRRMRYEDAFIPDVQRDDISSLLEQMTQTNDPNQQLYMLQELRNYNLDDGKAHLMKILDSERYHPIIKSFILQLFLEHQVEGHFKVVKFKQSSTFSLDDLQQRYNHPFRINVLNLLEDYLGSENPSLYEVMKEVWERVWLTLFPFLPLPTEEALWACGIHKLGYDLHGIEASLDELIEQYQADPVKLNKTIKTIIELEQLSNIGGNS